MAGLLCYHYRVIMLSWQGYHVVMITLSCYMISLFKSLNLQLLLHWHVFYIKVLYPIMLRRYDCKIISFLCILPLLSQAFSAFVLQRKSSAYRRFTVCWARNKKKWNLPCQNFGWRQSLHTKIYPLPSPLLLLINCVRNFKKQCCSYLRYVTTGKNDDLTFRFGWGFEGKNSFHVKIKTLLW
jgi:hypothetical protein